MKDKKMEDKEDKVNYKITDRGFVALLKWERVVLEFTEYIGEDATEWVFDEIESLWKLYNSDDYTSHNPVNIHNLIMKYQGVIDDYKNGIKCTSLREELEELIEESYEDELDQYFEKC